jgi:type IV pilus modification protein PilV
MHCNSAATTRTPNGFTIVELLLVLIIAAIVAGMAIPRIDFIAFEVNGAARQISSQLMASQRLAVLRQHGVVVAFDVAGGSMRIHEDRNNNGRVDAGEPINYVQLERAAVFGRGSAPPLNSRNGSRFLLPIPRRMAEGAVMSARHGFSLIEVIVALLVLSVGVLGMQLVAATMVRQLSVGQVQMSAAQLAEDRMDLIRLEPSYANLPSYVATEANLPGFTGFSRSTAVVHVRDSTAAGITDYRRVTVRVMAPGLTTPITRTLTVAAP